ncbi:MAG: hypothetical protein EHM23_19270 [Acidobacteria bacterium]|nr:MAG: hypothetical protein EHM23_19270 [Acidobacteriota bacterium]
MRNETTQVGERRFELGSAIGLSLFLTLLLDLGQFLFFECSPLPGLSLLFGLFAFAPISLLPVGVLMMRRKQWEGETRLVIALSISALILLVSLVCLGGLILTHLCP